MSAEIVPGHGRAGLEVSNNHRHRACSVKTIVNAFQWMVVWIFFLVVAVGLIWFLTRTKHH
jgi:hypothetical protein